MRRQLLSIPLFIVALIIGVYIVPFNATSGIRGMVNAFVNALRNDRPSGRWSLAPHYGRYGSPGKAVIEIGRDGITDVEQGESYSYRVISRSADGNSYLVELFDMGQGSNLRRYEYLEFSDPNWLAYFGYSSMDDYSYGRSSSSGSVTKISY